jgi:hypothetical protein
MFQRVQDEVEANLVTGKRINVANTFDAAIFQRKRTFPGRGEMPVN